VLIPKEDKTLWFDAVLQVFILKIVRVRETGGLRFHAVVSREKCTPGVTGKSRTALALF
jgi:hypothetical protein